jgi:hypothetical protein
MSEKHCRNTDGYYECFCPDGQSGNGTLADGCHKQDLTTKVAIGKHIISQIYFQCSNCLCIYRHIHASLVLVMIWLVRLICKILVLNRPIQDIIRQKNT